MEQSLGLLAIDNREKPSAAEYRRLARFLDGLGTGWEDRLPVVYVLAPPPTVLPDDAGPRPAFVLATPAPRRYGSSTTARRIRRTPPPS